MTDAEFQHEQWNAWFERSFMAFFKAQIQPIEDLIGDAIGQTLDLVDKSSDQLAELRKQHAEMRAEIGALKAEVATLRAALGGGNATVLDKAKQRDAA